MKLGMLCHSTNLHCDLLASLLFSLRFYFSVEKSNAKSVFFLNARMDCMYSFICNKYRVKYLRFPFIFFLLLSVNACLNISYTYMQENFSCKKIKCKNILVLVSRLWIYRWVELRSVLNESKFISKVSLAIKELNGIYNWWLFTWWHCAKYKRLILIGTKPPQYNK